MILRKMSNEKKNTSNETVEQFSDENEDHSRTKNDVSPLKVINPKVLASQHQQSDKENEIAESQKESGKFCFWYIKRKNGH